MITNDLISATAKIGAGFSVALFCLFPLEQTVAAPTVAAAYGERLVRSGQDWGEANLARAGCRDSSEIVIDSPDYKQQLRELEINGGAYARALAEPLADHGRALCRGGDLGAALDSYLRALHLVRINEGLNSPQQLPILRELIGLYRDTGDFEQLDGRYGYYFRLHGAGRPPFTEDRLQASLEYLRWQREALRLELDGNNWRRLMQLYRLNNELINLAVEDPGVEFGVRAALIESQLHNLYLIRSRVKPLVEYAGVGSARLSNSIRLPEEQNTDLARLREIQAVAVSQGAAQLRWLHGQLPENAVEDRLALRLKLADWYQWNGKFSSARGQYQQLYKDLQITGREDLLIQWLGEPVELPDNGVFWQPEVIAGDKGSVAVTAQFDVTARGRVIRAKTPSVAAEDERYATRLRRELRKIRFRPNYSQGEAQTTTLTREYVVRK